jgi:hypothetical protein
MDAGIMGRGGITNFTVDVTVSLQPAILWKMSRKWPATLKPLSVCFYGAPKALFSDNVKAQIRPLQLINADDPITLATYAKEHNLLTTPGWKD